MVGRIKLIAHRGNLTGPNPAQENNPTYIDEAIAKGYEVEIDLRGRDGLLYLGHDTLQYRTSIEWLVDRAEHLWIHCKNVEALENLTLITQRNKLHYFWHETDVATITSKGYIWAYPTPNPLYGSVVVLPELFNNKPLHCVGICSDFIEKYNYGKTN